MTYAFSWPLQQALFAALAADLTVAEIVGGRIYDAPPAAADLGPAPGPLLVIGEENVEPWSTATDRGAVHRLTLTAMSAEAGFGALKRLATAACEVALGDLALTRGRIVSAGFLGARTGRIEAAGLRRIDLRLRFAIEDA